MDELNVHDIYEFYYNHGIPIKNFKPKSFEVWEVPPIPRNIRLYSSGY